MWFMGTSRAISAAAAFVVVTARYIILLNVTDRLIGECVRRVQVFSDGDSLCTGNNGLCTGIQ